MKIRSIQITITLWAAACILAAVGIVTAYSSVSNRNNTLSTARDTLAAEVTMLSYQVDAEMEIPLDAGRTIAQMLTARVGDSASMLDRSSVTNMLKEVLSQNPTFFGTSTEWEDNAFDGMDADFAGQANTAPDGHFSPYWYRDGATISMTFLPRLADDDPAYIYYTQPKNSLEEIVTDPYLYPVNGVDVLMTSFMTPITLNGKFYGVAGVDKTLDSLQTVADNITEFNEQAVIQIYTYDGTVAAYTGKPEMIGKHISDVHADFEQDLENIQAGANINEEDEGNFLVSAPIFMGNYSKPWSVFLMVPMDQYLAEANKTMWISILIGVVVLLVALLVLYFVSGAIASPIKVLTRGALLLAQGDADVTGIDPNKIIKINNRADELGAIGRALSELMNYFKEMANHSESIANGDLTITVQPKGDTDTLGNTFVRMIANLRKSISQVDESSDQVTSASRQLASSADHAGQATSQIATTIQQVARGTAQQSESVNKTASSVDQMTRAIDGVARGAQEQASAAAKASSITGQLSSAIEQVAGNAQAVVQQSTAASDAAKKGTQKVMDTLTGMQNIKQRVGVSAEKVQEMGARSDQIGDIVIAIEDIASQTNLLALNAAIEAARAGEAGKGFAVVADEVRKLAERASAATKEIGGLIKSIQKTVSEAVSAMEDGAKEVERGVVIANEAGSALNEILTAAEAVNQQAEQAAAAAEQMSASANELVSAVDSVSAVVEENTAATEEMSAGSSEVTQAIENIASVSEENSAAVEEVSASAEEMSAQVEEVTAAAAELANLAQQLKAVVEQFKLE